ncbi:glycosyltransferase family 4 protein [Nodosilinea sp. LEGE 06152]|uniref:glycosyltransferase family 4 protein n=1 Tax=Nodosilinea sp. LEGE 06152 TaxID=2777966 RepID=UPI00187E2E85|nr:glycosyltransferase family 4 protein [Nodosilinea sp. LEGE 06152]MBE9158411.1 glycosyltransferase family 4 protein [Nodosilinea sp. LEGE 06152]
MRLLVIADPHIPIPPHCYGGTERIIHLLCQGLQNRGHIIDLIAGAGSRSYGGHLKIHQAPTLAYASRASRKLWFQYLCATSLSNVDIILNFGRIDYLELLLKTSKPLVCRFANPIHQTEIDFLVSRRNRKQLNLVGISQAQIAHLKFERGFHVVYNGVELERFQFLGDSKKSPPYLLFLGRLTQNKGVDVAIAVAQAAGVVLKIAGNIPNNLSDRQFFEAAIQPHLGYGCEWVGPVDDEQKNELLGNALALLFPIQWDEPFGIVMIESLACGTPIIATRRASTPEVIDHGKTGFLCESVNTMVEAVKQVHILDRWTCRHTAETRFSADVMVEQYLKVIS